MTYDRVMEHAQISAGDDTLSWFLNTCVDYTEMLTTKYGARDKNDAMQISDVHELGNSQT